MKRIFDLTFSIIFLVTLTPLFLVIYLYIKITLIFHTNFHTFSPLGIPLTLS